MSNLSKRSIEEAIGIPPIPENLDELLGISKSTNDEDEEDNFDVSKIDTQKLDTENLEFIRESMIRLKNMRSQLKDIPDILKRKRMLDMLATKAERAFDDVFDRSINCEDKFAADMINAATSILKIALDAHAKVLESDVKLISEQIKKDKMEIELNQKAKPSISENIQKDVENDDDVILLNRNALLYGEPKDK